jgi:hypothetical protein
MSEDMPQVPNSFGLHAKRAPEVDPVARLRRDDGGYRLGGLPLSRSPSPRRRISVGSQPPKKEVAPVARTSIQERRVVKRAPALFILLLTLLNLLGA